MFADIFKNVRNRLKGDFMPVDFEVGDFKQQRYLELSDLSKVQYFNNQYRNATITQDLTALIEFATDNKVEFASKQLRRINYTIRVHLVNKLLSDTSGMIPDEIIESHNSMVTLIRRALDCYRPVDASRRLLFTNLQPFQGEPGWLVTLLIFNSKLTI
ncbi:MAG: hypothetical protein WCY82_01745 [Desulfotomaculaceae bacterium]